MVAAALVWVATAGAAGCSVVDVGQADDGAGPIAVVVETPGFAPSAFVRYVAALEERGVDAVALRLPLPCHDPGLLLQQALPRAVSKHSGRPTAVVAHGWAGSLVVEALVSLAPEEQPSALALVGTPLRWERRTVWQDLFASVRPGRHWTPGARGETAAAQDAQALLLGQASLPLQTLGAAYVQQLQAWMAEGHSVSTQVLGLPVYAAAASLDRLAPVESFRPLLAPHQTFIRYGRASLLRHETDHSFLLQDRRPPTELATWVAETLGEAP